jgi:hypoxanthine phosphoribosyltransferase
MYTKKPTIPIETYYKDMQILSDKIIGKDFDCILALKRSGWILGAYLSNQKTLPLFTVSEVKSIPKNYERILIVDDKACTGKSFNKAINKLPLLVSYKTACLYVESRYIPDIYVKNLGLIAGMWYERN